MTAGPPVRLASRTAAHGSRAWSARPGTADEDALGQIVTEFSPMLWHVARAAGLSPDDAQDVVQTVWMSLLSHLEDVHTPGALAGWLVTTTRREAWRVRGAGRRQVPADQNWLAQLPDPGPGSEDLAIIGDGRAAPCGRPSGSSPPAARS